MLNLRSCLFNIENKAVLNWIFISEVWKNNEISLKKKCIKFSNQKQENVRVYVNYFLFNSFENNSMKSFQREKKLFSSFKFLNYS